MSISGNSFRDARGDAVRVTNQSAGAQTGTFTNNTIGVAGVPNSGSADDSGLGIELQNGGTSNWTVTNNTIRGYNQAGIDVLAPVASTDQPLSGTLNTTITGNTIVKPGNGASFAKQGIRCFIGGTHPSDSFVVCADIKSNTIDASGADRDPPSGVNVDVRMDQRRATTIRLPGDGGLNNDNTAVQNFVNANNSTGTTTLATNMVSTGGFGFTGTGTTCP